MKLNNGRRKHQYRRGFKHYFATEAECRANRETPEIKTATIEWPPSFSGTSRIYRTGTPNASRFASNP